MIPDREQRIRICKETVVAYFKAYFTGIHVEELTKMGCLQNIDVARCCFINLLSVTGLCRLY